jgi:nicotinamidase-related amidase
VAIAATRALVLVDLMPRMIDLALAPYSGELVLERCRRLAHAFRRAGDPVVLVRVERLGVTEQPHGSELATGLEQEGDVVLVKRSIGAFATTDLHAWLQARGVSTVVIGGIATTMGVESTARTAVDLGYLVEFVEDAMTGLAGDEHRWAIERVFPRLGTVTDVSCYGASADDQGRRAG